MGNISQHIVEDLNTALAARGTASLIVCGGSSPLSIFKELSTAPLPWSQITISLVDDRLVDADHPDSNEQLLKTTLLTGSAQAANFISLARAPQTVAALPRPFDVVLLGMGTDGHFASLFPDMMETTPQAFDPKAEPEIFTTEPFGTPLHSRISMNLAMILDARRVVLLVKGQDKQRVLETAEQGAHLPVSALVRRNPYNKHVHVSNPDLSL